uniref:4-hydroxy 2-oxovalerate aldolase n=1 Tax=Candidatus Kentrum sp. TC TaxID=2126339 RepID=A0A450YUA0_9GAMM|nr:MAG: 4-hydroxy 2-oxovalerate aldolase [Candidatus Kentron sp. TC]VFK45085.1 MAG: 4-hydroxy 2-oxovalerate aldolase [Candidatus Kentron sp. TC]VFK58259.1 MAG: 4-hydroxy 2-oxovalerate aldolase [Candidatus Kentron sp. TC]
MSGKRPIKETPFFTDTHGVLDATLRDAGYLNDWSFSREEIFAVVGDVARAGVEAIEVGYLSDRRDRPPAARCDAKLLSELRGHIEGSSNLAGMLSLGEERPAELFASRREVLDLVRLPCTLEEIPKALRIAETAAGYGIARSLNLVNISVLSRQQLIDAGRRIQESGLADLFYLADSRGACRPEDVRPIIESAREHWQGRLGFHAHDNTGFASVNSLLALEAGCQLIDGSVNGLGLGSGNTKIAHALALVQQRQPNKPYRYEPLDTLCREFSAPVPAVKSYLYYLVGAKNLAQLWVEPLLERYGDQAARRLQDIPRRPYTRIEQVIEEIES